MNRKTVFAAALLGALSLAGAASAAPTITISFAPAGPVPIGPWGLAAIAAALLLTGIAVMRLKGGARAVTLGLAVVAGLGALTQARPAYAIAYVDATLTGTTSPQTFPVTSAAGIQVTNNTGGPIQITGLTFAGGYSRVGGCDVGAVLPTGGSCVINTNNPS